MITVEKFGTTKDGREVLCFTLSDGDAYVKILNYGGILQSLVLPDKKGVPTNILLGYSTVKEYEENGGYLGALIGRFGNRIDGGKITVDGKEYSLYCNDNGNHLHGGRVGFNAKIWAHEIAEEYLILSLFSPDGEENYPGNLQVRVTYSFTGGALKIEYRAQSDKTTAVNLTNHAYFNLNGENYGSLEKHLLSMDSEYIVPVSERLIPTGNFQQVKDTAFDFSTPKEICRDIDGEDTQLRRAGGYDHCYLLKGRCGDYKKYAVARGEKTGITMTCFTDMPAVQFYSGNFLGQQGKTIYYSKRAGFCLETEAIPNNINVPEYAAKGSSILPAGEEYHFTAVYQFSL